jgi:phenylacetate-coenzyme A ligase PaaK-like adenylate-forming protein
VIGAAPRSEALRAPAGGAGALFDRALEAHFGLRAHDLYGLSEIVRGVNVYPSQLEAVLVGRPRLAPHYQLVLRRNGPIDEVTLEVEALPGVAQDVLPELAREVAQSVKAMVGISAQVDVKRPGEIPRSEGKAVRVRDLRPKDPA